MEFLLWISKFIIGPVVAVIVTLLVKDPLMYRLAPIVVKLGSKKETGITGTWRATFYYGKEEKPYVEIIKISSLLGQYVGHIEPHEDNHAAVKEVQESRPLRLRGSIKDSRFFTGLWFHPNKINHHHGAFKLIIRTNHYAIIGMWLGYSQSKKVIEAGRWEWERMK